MGTDALDFVEVAKYDYETKKWSTNLLVRPQGSEATIDYLRSQLRPLERLLPAGEAVAKGGGKRSLGLVHSRVGG